MTRFTLLIFLASVGMSGIVLAQPPVRSGYDIAWSDEFNGTTLDTSRWTASSNSGGGGNFSLQHYLPQMVTVSGGRLVITSDDTPTALKPYRSGLIETNSTYQKYGRWDVRAKLPATKGYLACDLVVVQQRNLSLAQSRRNRHFGKSRQRTF